MKFRLRQVINIAAILMTATLLYSCTSDGSKQSDNGEKPIGVTTSLPKGNSDNGFRVSGKVEALQKAVISTRVMGYVTNIRVSVGDKVNKGQLLASIDSRDIQARKAQSDAMVAEAEAAYANAKKDYERFTSLYEQKSATAKEFENISFQYNSAQSRLEVARQMRNEADATLSYAQIVAPYEGTITQKYIDNGSMATPGMPILELETNHGFQVTASIPESEIGNLTKGDTATITIKTINKTFQTSVTAISSSSLSSGGQFLIRIIVPKEASNGLFSGQYANIEFKREQTTSNLENKAILVPLNSIIYNDQLTGIYTISTLNTAILRWVRLGKIYGDNVEVLTGLAHNERFVVKSESKLWNGAPIVLTQLEN
ncbi:MAG: efflux RND transporter periplasmic adaptor subunit [Breznakibacter sp.]|nr:efflux RND transporter periplasmic adaptor subunit [Breznakibacter sp.]